MSSVDPHAGKDLAGHGRHEDGIAAPVGAELNDMAVREPGEEEAHDQEKVELIVRGEDRPTSAGLERLPVDGVGADLLFQVAELQSRAALVTLVDAPPMFQLVGYVDKLREVRGY